MGRGIVWSARSVTVNAKVTVHKASQRRITDDWLAPQETDCSRMHSKVSCDWLPTYIKATRLVLEIFKMVGYFRDSPRLQITTVFRVLIESHLQEGGADYINTVLGNKDGDKEDRIKVAQRSSSDLIY
jgi:hypothetical protein